MTESASDSVDVYDDAVTRADLDAWESELQSLIRRMNPLFYRTESRRHAEHYLRGLLSPLARKNGWTIAEYVAEPEPKALPRLPHRPPSEPTRRPVPTPQHSNQHPPAP